METLGGMITSAVSTITSVAGSISTTIFGGLIAIFVGLGVIGGIVRIFR